jgi:isoquinoline 1-oxidoreductase subunit beta
MTDALSLDRRGFIVGASALGGGLTLGMRLPFDAAQAAETSAPPPEVNAWVVIKPDETIIVRIARS